MKIRAARTFDEEATNFLNVDLDIFSKSRLEKLVAAFGNAISVLYVGREGSRYSAHLELGQYFGKDADSEVKALTALVRRLPTSARRIWENAQTKDFNIGIQGGIRPHYSEFPLKAKTLGEVARLGARVVITVYAAETKSAYSTKRKIRKRGKRTPSRNRGFA